MALLYKYSCSGFTQGSNYIEWVSWVTQPYDYSTLYRINREPDILKTSHRTATTYYASLLQKNKGQLIKYSSHTFRDWWAETQNYKQEKKQWVRLTSYPHWGNLVGNQRNRDRAICYFSNKTERIRPLQLSWLPHILS